MALKEADVKNFETLQDVFKNGHIALVESRDAKTLEYRAVICAVTRDKDGTYIITPFGHMCTGNPYEDYVDPTQENLDEQPSSKGNSHTR